MLVQMEIEDLGWGDVAGFNKREEIRKYMEIKLCACGCGKPILLVKCSEGNSVAISFEPDDILDMINAYKKAGYAALVIE